MSTTPTPVPGADTPGPLFRLSYTKLSTYEHCRKQYWFEYLSGYPRPEDEPNVAGVVGTGVHKAMHVLCQTDEPEAGAAELDTYLRMPAHECAGPGTEGHRDAFTCYAQGCAAHRSIAGETRYAEQDSFAPYAQGGVNLYARIDRIDRLGPHRWQVIDWKTGRSDNDDATDAQLDLAHVVTRTIRRLPREATVRAVAWNLRTGALRVRELERKDAAATVYRFAAIARQMVATTEFEPHPGRGCAYCRWRPQCPDASRAETPDWSWLEDEDEAGKEAIPGGRGVDSG